MGEGGMGGGEKDGGRGDGRRGEGWGKGGWEEGRRMGEGGMGGREGGEGEWEGVGKERGDGRYIPLVHGPSCPKYPIRTDGNMLGHPTLPTDTC